MIYNKSHFFAKKQMTIPIVFFYKEHNFQNLRENLLNFFVLY